MKNISITGHGEPVLLLHGMSGPSFMNKIKAELCNHYLVILPTLPGFTTNHVLLNYNDKSYVQYIESLRKELGFSSWIVIGYSLGGRIALNYALHYPTRVKRLALLNTLGIEYINPLLKIPMGKVFMEHILQICLRYHPFKRNIILHNYSFKDRKNYLFVKSYFNYILKDPLLRKNFIKIYLYLAKPIANLNKKLIKLDTSTLILWSEDDQTSSLLSGYHLHQMLRHSTMHVLKHYKHNAPFENPNFYTKHILYFLSTDLT